MQRREVVKFLGAALALPFLPRSAEAVIKLGGQMHARLGNAPFRTFDPAQRALVQNIPWMMIPGTEPPGATSVKEPDLIDLIIAEWVSEDEKSACLAGLKDID